MEIGACFEHGNMTFLIFPEQSVECGNEAAKLKYVNLVYSHFYCFSGCIRCGWLFPLGPGSSSGGQREPSSPVYHLCEACRDPCKPAT